MKLVAGVAALSCLLVANLPASAAGMQRAEAVAPADKQRLEIFDFIWREVRDKYYDPTLNKADWVAARDRYRPLVAGAQDESAFYAVLRSLVGELRDAHTRVLTARQAEERKQERATSTGLILFEAEGQPVVFQVRPGSPAAEAGLTPGLRVLAIDGIPIAEALAKARAEVGPSSSERAARVLAYLRLVSGPPARPLRLDLLRPNGTRMEVQLARRPLATEPRFESRTLPSGHLLVKFDRLDEPVARRFRAALEQARTAPGLILDLRSNPGGDGKEGMRTIAPLLAEQTLIARLSTRTGKRPSALLGLVSLPLALSAGERGRQIYAGPVVILTNAGTGSTSEVIAASLQERGRAKIVGTRSCGCALGVLKYRKLADGGLLAISEVGLVTGLGRRIEGAGVTPDLEADLTLSDLQQGTDSVLAAAVRQLELIRTAGR